MKEKFTFKISTSFLFIINGFCVLTAYRSSILSVKMSPTVLKTCLFTAQTGIS